jgi:hypothetical protein
MTGCRTHQSVIGGRLVYAGSLDCLTLSFTHCLHDGLKTLYRPPAGLLGFNPFPLCIAITLHQQGRLLRLLPTPRHAQLFVASIQRTTLLSAMVSSHREASRFGFATLIAIEDFIRARVAEAALLVGTGLCRRQCGLSPASLRYFSRSYRCSN